jgi:peroxiredoxin
MEMSVESEMQQELARNMGIPLEKNDSVPTWAEKYSYIIPDEIVRRTTAYIRIYNIHV